MVNIMAFNKQMPYIFSTVLSTLSLFSLNDNEIKSISFYLHKLWLLIIWLFEKRKTKNEKKN